MAPLCINIFLFMEQINKQKASIYLASSSMSSSKSFISIPNALDDIENMIVKATKYKYEKNKEE